MIETYQHNLDKCLLKVDFSNTFNWQEYLFQAHIEHTLSELLSWAEYCHNLPAELRFGDT